MPASLRIEGKGATASGYRVYLNDEDISKYIPRLSLNMDVGEVTTATIDGYVDRIEVDADVEPTLAGIQVLTPERTTFASRFREWIKW